MTLRMQLLGLFTLPLLLTVLLTAIAAPAYLLEVVLIGGLSWLLIFLFVDVLILKRVSRLQRALSQTGMHTVGKRVDDTGNDELGLLTQAVDRLLDRLEHSEARDRAILDGMADGYFELDKEARIESVNLAFCSMLGFSPAQLLGRTFGSLQSEGAIEPGQVPVLTETEPGAPLSGCLLRADGSEGYFETQLSSVRDVAGRVVGYRGILHDVSEHVHHQQALYKLAYHDALTGLGNRKAFYEELSRHLPTTTSHLALLFLDLDRFKKVNDSYGHEVGDALLVNIAARLQNAVRQADSVYRLGGDEFTVILPAADYREAREVAERLLKVLSEPVSAAGVMIDFVTPSIGLALAPDHATAVGDLLKAADEAMYEAKQLRGRLCVYQPVQATSG